MRRLAMASGALAVAATLVTTGGFGGIASASVHHVQPGTVWTIELNQLNCEIQTIHAGNTWVSDLFGDAGTYRGGARTFSETWTSGAIDAGTTFSGRWHRATQSYVGVFHGGLRNGVTGQLVSGVVSSWDGATC
jgi:hypothetical protein